MEILLSPRVKAITGSLGSGYGYHIQRRKERFFGKRNTKGVVPRDGHLRFIFACADLARTGLHISEVRVRAHEMRDALSESGKWMAAQRVEHNIREAGKHFYNARDIVNLKITFGL